MIFPNDVKEVQSIDINRFYWLLRNTSKHIMGGYLQPERNTASGRNGQSAGWSDEASSGKAIYIFYHTC